LSFKRNFLAFLRDLKRSVVLLWTVDKKVSRISILLQLFQAFLPIASLYFMKSMIEAVLHHYATFYPILPFIAGYAVTQLMIVCINQYSSFIDIKHQHKITDKLSGEILQKAIEVDYEYYENPLYHDTLHLAQQQAAYKIPQVLKDFNPMLVNILSLAFLVGFFFTIHALFALFLMVVFIPLAVTKWYSGFKLLQLEKKFVPMEREANYLNQTLTSVNPAKEVRVFGYGNSFIKKFMNIRAIIHHEKTTLHAKLTWYNFLAEAGEVIAMSFVFALLAEYTWEKIITLGVFVIYLQGFQRLQASSKGFLQALVQLFQQRLFLRDLFAFLDLKTSKVNTSTAPFPPSAAGLKVTSLSFAYPGTGKLVLDGISLVCKPGKIVALVGENGSGKTTLIKLLARLYETQTGDIKINGTDINQIELNAFRKKSVFLFQDFEKYFLSIEDNITLGDNDGGKMEKDVERAAQLAQAHDFIVRLSKSYKTRIGRYFKDSEQLSGGQWQKLALSRIFYRDANLVVLDEPTSSLDPNAEFEVFENLKKNLKDQMIIVVTHRLYNLKIADHIYLLKDGCINQEGDFETLVKEDGEFKKMYSRQKL